MEEPLEKTALAQYEALHDQYWSSARKRGILLAAGLSLAVSVVFSIPLYQEQQRRLAEDQQYCNNIHLAGPNINMGKIIGPRTGQTCENILGYQP